MNNKKNIKKALTVILISLFSLAVSAQNEISLHDNLNGSYTILVKSTKNLDFELTEERMSEIESLRLENEDLTNKIDGYSIRIMSREKKEGNSKWPLYTILN